ncbi:MAG: SpoIIIAH-like family protein [Firmicutes bacterium]|nr:SpoIIIAH-like family protein [Bacillota bacterium]
MFYVITRKTLGKGFLVMLLLALVLWLAWNTFGKDSALNNGGGAVLWPRLVPSQKTAPLQEEQDPSPLGVASEQVGPISGPDTYSVASEVDVVPTTISVGNLIDEYLPASPIYSEDLTFAIAAAGPLAVVEPLNRRDTFAEFRWERDRSRSRQLEVLQEIVTDGISSEQQKETAQGRLVAIMAGCEIEMELEGLLMAQGLPDAVVVLSETGATVMVDTVLTEEEAARIGDTISGMTGMSLEKIRIIDQRS